MKKVLLGLSLCSAIFATSVSASAQSQKGESFFNSKGCALCHKKNIDGIGPSLKTIAIAYSGKEMNLVSYLQSQGTPIVEPARAVVMNPQLVKIKALFEDDIKAIAEYIISANDRPN